MKNSLKKLTARGKWFRVETTKAFAGGIMNQSFAAGVAGYARRNSLQPQFIKLIAPTVSSPEQIAAWHLTEEEAERALVLIEPVGNETDCGAIWQNIWNNFFTIKKNKEKFDGK